MPAKPALPQARDFFCTTKRHKGHEEKQKNFVFFVPLWWGGLFATSLRYNLIFGKTFKNIFSTD